ncbi:MAG: energy transducer TonB [Pseudoxanthomonas suwonensis]|nr:MAG: energy transducer TonB [Pseudoxanthomonas suwonensis]
MSPPSLFRRHALCGAVLLALAIVTAQPVQAQSVTGAVAGRANAGDQITVTHASTGFTRTVTADASGNYRLGALQVGQYTLQVTRDGQPMGEPIAVDVALGGTTTVNLDSAGGVANLAAVTVVGERVVNRVDVRSTESATNVTREEIARMPVDQSLASVALLAPGVIGGNASFGGISFGGSSIAENSIFINGLNVTDFYRRHSFSTAPFAFFKEFQVKTGGYSVEFGRSTGGVINAVSRSGSNEFHGGVELTFEPKALRSSADDHYYDDGSVNVLSSHDERAFFKANAWASGPLVQDKLFLFAMYERRNSDSGFTRADGVTWTERSSNDGFWGAKLDWNITDNHLLGLLAFSDAGDSKDREYAYDFDTSTVDTEPPRRSTASTGGRSESISYTGYFGENFTVKAMYGINRSSSYVRSPADSACDWVTYNAASYRAAYEAMGSPILGCHPGSDVVSHDDQRKVKRLDLEWALGGHLLRFGWDHELMTTDRVTFYPGSGIQYTAYGRTSPNQVLDNDAVLPAGVNAFLMGRRRADGGVFDIEASALYIEDEWSITPNFLLNIGLRLDNFENLDAAGDSYIKLDKLLSPRLGFSWDMKGDGSTKLFGNLGRYYMPVPSIISYNFAGGLTDERSFYVLDGWRPETDLVTGAQYMAPIIGAQIGPVDDSFNLSNEPVDRDLDAVYQDELILGFQTMIDQAWSWGVNATYRRMPNAMDDIRINALCGTRHSNVWAIANPGDELTLWGTTAIGCAQDGWVTIDTSREGYMMAGSNRIIGYSDPKRTYKSVEFQIDRAWDNKWAFNASYLWSKLEGNHEGPVNSDTNYGDTGMVQHWDHPANNDRYGDLFNDHRHQIKLRGSYKFNDMWMVGGTLTAVSGGPITAFGVSWPGESGTVASPVSEGSGGGTGWLCVPPAGVANCSTVPWQDRVYERSERGAFGRMPWIYNLGASVTWTLPVDTIDLKARLSVYNLLNAQEEVNVSARYEAQPGQRRDTFGTGTRWQSPRHAQLVITWNF